MVAKGSTNRATSSLICCSFATNRVTGNVAIELEVAKAVSNAFEAEEIKFFGFLRATNVTINNCQKICK